MKKSISSIVLFSAAACLTSFSLGACSKSNNKSPVSGAASGSGSVSTSGHANHVDGASASCENPIAVDGNGGDLSSLTGQFKLDSIQMYNVETQNNNSFSASANAANGWKVSVDCQGVRDLTSDNYDKTWTDQDGSHEDKETASSDMNGSFQAGEVADLVTQAMSQTQRKISVSFKNGQLVSATSEVIPTEGATSGGLKSIPKGPIDLGNGNSITINAAPLDGNSFELKMKIESAKDGTVVLLEYGRVVFVRK